MTATSAVASALDLAGRDLRAGTVELTWTYPMDPGPAGITFDVYSGTDPLAPFRTLRLPAHPTMKATLAGFTDGGPQYFTVVARRGDLLALPSPVVRVDVQPVRPPVVVTATGVATATGVGLGFPFGVGPAGRIRADGGDDLLHGKIVQLLLTTPGERVNLPDYGTRLRDLVFEPNDPVLAAATEFAVARALARFLGDEIEVDAVQVAGDDNELLVDIVYVRRSDLRGARLRIGIPLPRAG